MENLLISQILNSFDSTPVNPSREERFLAFTVCKNLSDLCETGRAIVNNIVSRGLPIHDLPDRDNIAICQQLMDKFYSNDMFVPDEDFGNKPNWNVINLFNREQSDIAYKIYCAIRRNVVEDPVGKDIQNAIKQRNKTYFINNFDQLFANIPFKEALVKFKNFVACPHAFGSDQEYVWEFFDALLDIFIYEPNNLEDLKFM